MIKPIIISTLFMLGVSYSFAQPTQSETSGQLNEPSMNTITTAVPFMSITPDSRAGGMGDAGTALSATANSIYWNTSMLNFSEEDSEISVSYTPWLRQLTNDMHLSYVSGYYKFGSRHVVGGALRFFSLGSITFTSPSGDVLRDDNPAEYEITGAYSFKTSDRTSVGVNGKFVYSNLTGGIPVGGVATKAGVGVATDISFTYFNDQAKIGGTKGDYTFVATLNNVGNKISYSTEGSNDAGDFMPQNIRIGNSFRAKFDAYNDVVFAVDVSKLLVPTPAIYGQNDDGSYFIKSGYSNDIGTIAGMLQSFYDAPGVIQKDESGDELQNADGSYQIVKSSKFKEELTEINVALGLEYWYNNLFAVRSGFYYENMNKGARQYFNFGVGLKYNKFGIDISYLAAIRRNNPLANTLRFTLSMALGESNSKSSDSAPE